MTPGIDPAGLVAHLRDRHGCSTVLLYGSVARGEDGPAREDPDLHARFVAALRPGASLEAVEDLLDGLDGIPME